jgi:putative phosphoribosyl transferase
MSVVKELGIEVECAVLPADLTLPDSATGIVVFAHGSGSSRKSSRNRFVAESLAQAGLATLLFDLLTPTEDQDYERRFDIPLLTDRLEAAVLWCGAGLATSGLRVGLFGASTGAAAALSVAARLPQTVRAVVSRGGRPDLAWDDLPDVCAATLLIVGGLDLDVLELNRRALERIPDATLKRLDVVPNAGHLFEEPGALEHVAGLARDWLRGYLA